MKVVPHQLRTKVTNEEQLNHNIYLLKCKLIQCANQIDFYTEILNNPKANVEVQRNMLFNIEAEELAMLKYNQQLNKLI